MKKIKIILSLLRIHNLLIGGLAVLTFSSLLDAQLNHFIFFIAIIVMLVMGLGNMVNDIIDIQADTINHPASPTSARTNF